MLFSRLLKIILGLTVCASSAVAASKPVKKPTQKPSSKPPITKPTTIAPDPRFAKWATVKKPKAGATEIYGGYAKGCITGAAELPMQSPNYTIVNLNDRRIYGHPDLVKYIKDLGGYLRSKKVPAILIEDLSGPRGGPVIKGHASHQNGLDVDISYTLPTKPLTLAERAQRPEISFVKDGSELTPAWTNRQTLLVVSAVRADEVDRVFVAPAIKKLMCEKFPTAPWLYKLRAWWGHQDHLHVRLKCPADQKHCVPQYLDPEDTQCGPSLDRWMKMVKPPAVKPVVQPTPPAKKFPTLPPQCENVVKD
jgi:penicillin-insensitive murein DD-endopeptidase